uniref:AB hydrolase-1 domain-containing protein n=1 Tax=Steinernema glaseri TaxID=37863 RepID=A0A1I7Z3Q8_9BILA
MKPKCLLFLSSNDAKILLRLSYITSTKLLSYVPYSGSLPVLTWFVFAASRSCCALHFKVFPSSGSNMAEQPPLLACCIRMVIMMMMSVFWTAVAATYMLIEYFKFGKEFLEKKEHPKPRCLEGWTHSFADLKEIRMHYVEMGELGKPLMVFVHGFPEFWYSWRHQLRHFQNDYHSLPKLVEWLARAFLIAVDTLTQINLALRVASKGDRCLHFESG